MVSFVHQGSSEPTTLGEIQRIRAKISADAFFGFYAYATQSGFRAFELGMGQDFWTEGTSKWLLGIDYGRSDPRALVEIANQKNSEVRIFDGRYVVDSAGFVPRRDYHPKLALLKNASSGDQGLVLGSGNFSFNGLCRSVEAGFSVYAGINSKKSDHTRRQGVLRSRTSSACARCRSALMSGGASNTC